MGCGMFRPAWTAVLFEPPLPYPDRGPDALPALAQKIEHGRRRREQPDGGQEQGLAVIGICQAMDFPGC